MKKCEWKMGTSTTKGTIWFRMKGSHNSRFYHNFLDTIEAEEFVKDLLLIIQDDKNRKNGEYLSRIEHLEKQNLYKTEIHKFRYKKEG